jgi:hypothetical protein
MPEMTLLTIAIGLGVLMALLLAGKYWSESNDKDLGTMSEKWVAEHNASTHP